MGTSQNTRGIVLAGGQATRLYPATKVISKQLLPIYDKPMIYYPLSVLMLAGVREIMVISTPEDLSAYERLLGDGHQLGLSFRYREQAKPEGLPQAFLLARDFIAGHPSCLILGDNIFYGDSLGESLRRFGNLEQGATIFAYWVKDPERYGVVVFDRDGKAKGLFEKPTSPVSNWAVTGLYFYDPGVVDLARGLTPSGRGELEITDVNRAYLERGELQVERLGRGVAWLDTGTHASLASAGEFVRIIEERQGLKICCPEEIAYARGLVDRDQMLRLAETMKNSAYGDYLLKVIDQGAMP